MVRRPISDTSPPIASGRVGILDFDALSVDIAPATDSTVVSPPMLRPSGPVDLGIERRSAPWLSIAAALATPFLFLLQLPRVLSFRQFAFEDTGTTHHALSLIASGMRPMIDFGYPYGLMNLAAGQAWFAALGSGAYAYFLLVLALHAVTGLGLWRMARAMPDRRFALLLVIAAAAHATAVWGLVYAFEAALLAQCLGALAWGRRGEALAWATACLFVKPSMAYVLGFFIVVVTALECVRTWRRPGGRFLHAAKSAARTIAPAAGVLVGCGVLLGLLYGWMPLLRTLFPVAGKALYNSYGISHALPAFLRPLREGNWLYIIGSNFVPYVAGSLALLAIVPALTWTVLRTNWHAGPAQRHAAAMGWAGGMSMLVFLAAFFGGLHYVPLLVAAILGAFVAVPALRGRVMPRRIAIGVFLLTTPCVLADGMRGWFMDAPSGATCGLWALPGEAAEWQQAKHLAAELAPAGRRPLVLSGAGGIDAIDATLVAPSSVYLQPGIASEGEFARIEREMASATVAIHPLHGIFSVYHERYRPLLDQFEVAHEGRFYRVLVRQAAK